MKSLKNTGILAVSLIAIATTSCTPKDKEDAAVIPVAEHGYALGFRTTSAGGATTADYFLTTSDLMSGSITATNNGVEQAGWCYYGKSGSTLFSLDYTFNECKGYTISGGKINEAGRFIFERMDVMYESEVDNKMIAIGAPWGGGSFDCQIQLVDNQDISIHKNVKTPIYVSHDTSGAQLNAWPTSTFIQDGKLYVSFYPLNGASWETSLTDTAYVSVYSYPSLDYLSTFKDTRTGPIGYYGGSPCLLKAENGDRYTLSTAALSGGFTQATKPSGILRINKGAVEFDASYFFNVEALGYKVLAGTYAGNGKIVARVIDVATDIAAPEWAIFVVTDPLCKVAVIDVNTKTVTIVNDVPLHGAQYQTPFFNEGGKVYMSINTGTAANVYQIDPTTATAVKGATIAGDEIQAFFKY